ncbi:MAG: sulfite exporter TauE/SafE family protein [Kineosporiaceae bacterium]
MTVGDLAPLGVTAMLVLALAAVLIGFSKTAVGGVALISVAIFAAVLPSRLSTGVVLPLLLVGDVVAVRTYHAHADWAALLRLIPAVALGVGLGVVFVARADDAFMRQAIGAVLVGLVALHLVMRHRSRGRESDPPARPPANPWASWGFGSLAGFTTTVANAGGPAMHLYLLNARYSVLGFLGTTSWFFFVVNLLKVPFSVGLDLITTSTLRLDLILAPGVLLGTWLGRRVIPHIQQDLFEKLVLLTTVLAGLNLLR